MKQGEGAEMGGGAKGVATQVGRSVQRGVAQAEWTGWAHCPSCAPVCAKRGEGVEMGGHKGGSHASGATCMKGGVSMWGSRKW